MSEPANGSTGRPVSGREDVRAILLRDKYRCTETVTHRISGHVGRCPVMGSEMVVRDARAMCPRHAREWQERNA
jgi:hypothetical protein